MPPVSRRDASLHERASGGSGTCQGDVPRNRVRHRADGSAVDSWAWANWWNATRRRRRAKTLAQSTFSTSDHSPSRPFACM